MCHMSNLRTYHRLDHLDAGNLRQNLFQDSFIPDRDRDSIDRVPELMPQRNPRMGLNQLRELCMLIKLVMEIDPVRVLEFILDQL